MVQALLTRRRVLQTAVAATTLAAPFVRGAYAAGKLSFGVWDHWVPGASEVLGKLCREWAEREKVDLTFDLITSNGDKDLLTLMAEGQARAATTSWACGCGMCPRRRTISSRWMMWWIR